MRNIVLKMAVVLLLFVAAVFSLNQTQASNSVSINTDDPTPEQIYDQYCARCHGTDGKAETRMGKSMGARNFTDKTWQNDTKDEDILETIKEGNGAMPSFKNKLTEDKVKSLVGRIRKFKPEEK